MFTPTYRTPVRYYLRNSRGEYFRHPQGDDNREWDPDIHTAHAWVDPEMCAAAAKTFRMIHGLNLTVVNTNGARV